MPPRACWFIFGYSIAFFLDGDHDRYHLEGLMESPSVNDDGDCFSPILLNASSINIEVYYNKAVNYTLMVTFVSFINSSFLDYWLFWLHLDGFFNLDVQVSFLQVLLLIRQMEHSNTQSVRTMTYLCIIIILLVCITVASDICQLFSVF